MRSATAISALAIAVLNSLAAAQSMPLALFDAAKYPLARCNDGTPSGYYFLPGTTDTWIIQQQGGDWCYDAASCGKRLGTNLGSSANWPQTWTAAGILASTDPVLAGANIIYAPYCTSDAWIGDAVVDFPGGGPTNFHFAGSHVVDAIVSELVLTHGLGSQPGAKVLYSGCSAGARGVLFNLPRMPALLSALVPHPLSSFGALLDSAFWVDIAPFNNTVIPFEEEVQDVWGLINASALVNPACTAAYPGQGAGWHCLMAQFALPYLAKATPPVPYFLHAFQYDAFQLGHDWGLPFGKPPQTQAQAAYGESFRNYTRSVADTDVINPSPPGVAGMLPACFKHCNTEGSTWGTPMANGYSLEQAVAAWFAGLSGDSKREEPVTAAQGAPPSSSAAVPRFIVDNCTGFNCGTGCPPV